MGELPKRLEKKRKKENESGDVKTSPEKKEQNAVTAFSDVEKTPKIIRNDLGETFKPATKEDFDKAEQLLGAH